MKKFIYLFITLCIFTLNSFAQTKVSEYHSDYFDRNYKICASLNKSETAIDDLYIYVAGESKTERVVLRFEDPLALVEALKEIKNKYAEWIEVANNNNVTDISKDIPIKLPSASVCWYGSKWWFSFNHKYNFRFTIFNSDKKIILIYDKVKSSSNEYIEQEFYWVFESVEELNEFINVLDISEITNQLKNKSNNTELFQ